MKIVFFILLAALISILASLSVVVWYSQQKTTLTLYGDTLCSDNSSTEPCFEVVPNKTYCYDNVCFTKPDPWQ